jgi:N-methylhydantoinase A
MTSVYFSDRGRTEVPIYFGPTLEPGMAMDGPAVIEEPTTTIVLYPKSSGRVTSLGNYVITINQ